MKDLYKWYTQPSKSEIDDAWENGTLTVDANVLLDLYRYHSKTKQDIISSIGKFKGRLWLSNQAAEEFIRNRSKVIYAAGKTFSEAEKIVQSIKSTAETVSSSLRSHRLIPRSIAENLEKSLCQASDQAEKSIKEIKESHPNYIKDNDDILKDIFDLFDGQVGKPFDTERLKTLEAEAERRLKMSIPPGYLDHGKDGTQRYGDFLLWTQVLDKLRASTSPMILVTSERKEDWWEIYSGERVKPRLELLREAWDHASRRIFIYQTDYFLEQLGKRSGKSVAQNTVQEVREVGDERTYKQDSEQAVSVIQVTETANDIINEGYISLNISRPIYNATGTGHFTPKMSHPPKVEVELILAPTDKNSIKVSAATGTLFDFNVHMKTDPGKKLPPGEYIFKYQAHVDRNQQNQNFNTALQDLLAELQKLSGP